MTSAPPPIAYEPQHVSGIVSIDREGDTLRIELRPMSTWTFVATIWVPMIWTGGAASFLGLTIWSHESLALPWVVCGVVLLIALALLVATCRRRGATRMIWVSPDRIGWRDCRIGQTPVFTRHQQTLTPAWVERRWWRPWVCELKVRPVIPYFSIGRSDPVVLAIDTDRNMLESLLPLIEAARIAVEDAHVRGAFEVLPVQRPEARGTS